MATNDFIGFASNGSANVMSQTDFVAAVEQGIGVQPGMASSALANKVWRQGANMAAALGRIAAARGYDALDNGDLNTLQSAIDDTISVGTFNRMYFSQTSGNFVAPRTGVYRITLKGGGGGGAGAQTASFVSGGGGGEGAAVCFYTSLTRGVAYPYVIGAGGSAGADVSSGNSEAGGEGGTSSITINDVTTSVRGGGGAPRATLHDSLGGVPGLIINNAPAYSIIWGGSAGMSGGKGTSGLPYEYTFGGGATGYQASPNRSPINGAGGCGSGRLMQAQNGADGYILIEYAG